MDRYLRCSLSRYVEVASLDTHIHLHLTRRILSKCGESVMHIALLTILVAAIRLSAIGKSSLLRTFAASLSTDFIHPQPSTVHYD